MKFSVGDVVYDQPRSELGIVNVRRQRDGAYLVEFLSEYSWCGKRDLRLATPEEVTALRLMWVSWVDEDEV